MEIVFLFFENKDKISLSLRFNVNRKLRKVYRMLKTQPLIRKLKTPQARDKISELAVMKRFFFLTIKRLNFIKNQRLILLKS